MSKIFEAFTKSPRISSILKRGLSHARDSSESPGKIKAYYETLNLRAGSNSEEVRAAFIKLAKRLHPDSGSPNASKERFQEVKEAYGRLLEYLNENPAVPFAENEADDVDSVHDVDYGIKHKPPQFRKYLTYEGVGEGPPGKRMREYQKIRANLAAENVLQHRLNKYVGEASDNNSLLAKDTREAKKQKSAGFGFERLVEDLIQESMAKGEFNNLKGSGKPLERYKNITNPYVDTVTQKINEVLIDNGFAPEWIQLEKEIRIMRDSLRKRLQTGLTSIGPSFASRHPRAVDKWEKLLKSLEQDVADLNVKIDKYNLVVPIMSRQTVRFNLAREAEKVQSSVSSSDLKESSGRHV